MTEVMSPWDTRRVFHRRAQHALDRGSGVPYADDGPFPRQEDALLTRLDLVVRRPFCACDNTTLHMEFHEVTRRTGLTMRCDSCKRRSNVSNRQLNVTFHFEQSMALKDANFKPVARASQEALDAIPHWFVDRVYVGLIAQPCSCDRPQLTMRTWFHPVARRWMNSVRCHGCDSIIHVRSDRIAYQIYGFTAERLKEPLELNAKVLPFRRP